MRPAGSCFLCLPLAVPAGRCPVLPRAARLIGEKLQRKRPSWYKYVAGPSCSDTAPVYPAVSLARGAVIAKGNAF